MSWWRTVAIFSIALCVGCRSAAPADCDLSCGAHEACVIAAAGPSCECVAGYEGDPAADVPCEWGGGLVDPGFESPDSWTTSGPRIVPLSEGGPKDRGVASFDETVLCDAGSISQVVEMPSYDDAEPFVVEATFRVGGTSVDFGYDRAFRRLTATEAWPFWTTDRFCLGEAAYGKQVKFQVAARERASICYIAPEGQFEIDRLEILVADEGECPTPGNALNGEAELDQGGWVFLEELNRPGDATGSLAPDVGESQTSGARLSDPAGSEKRVGMYTPLSVPLAASLPSPVLRFWWHGPRDSKHFVSIGTVPPLRSLPDPLDLLVSDGSPQVATYCLPPWTHGNVVDLFFMPLSPGAENNWLVVDNVEIESDDRCGDATDLLDPGFDSGPDHRWPGGFVFPEEESGSDVRLLHDEARAEPPGDGLLEISYATNRTDLDVHFLVWVPKPEGNRLPQLLFRSNVPAEEGALPVTWVLGESLVALCESCPLIPITDELPRGLGWQPNAICLPVEWAERWYKLRIRIRGSENSDDPFMVFDPPRTVLLDNFEVTLDEGCPDTRVP